MTADGRRMQGVVDHPHVVVVGAGFAGLEVARGLARAPARVTVIDRRNFHLFVPLLYQVATAALSPAEVTAPIRAVLRRYRNVEVLLGTVTGVDTGRREVQMGPVHVPYDILVLATGSGQSYFGHDEWAAHAPGLKTIEDAREIRGKLLMAFERAEITNDEALRRRLMTMVVVGGGPTGVEMAGSIVELARETLKRDFRHIRAADTRVILLEAADRLLAPFPEELRTYAHRKLEELGVEVRLNCMVEAIGPTGVTAGGEHFPSEVVVWGAGVAASPAARWLGIEPGKGGTVPVDENLRVPGLEDVYVLGDTALCLGEDGQPLPQLAQVAKQQGQYLGKALHRRVEGRPWPGPFRFTNYGNMATIGRNAAVADFGWWRTGGFLAWLLWGVIHVFLLIGFRNRVIVSLQWLWIYVTHQRGARLITGETKATIIEEPGAASD